MCIVNLVVLLLLFILQLEQNTLLQSQDWGLHMSTTIHMSLGTFMLLCLEFLEYGGGTYDCISGHTVTRHQEVGSSASTINRSSIAESQNIL